MKTSKNFLLLISLALSTLLLTACSGGSSSSSIASIAIDNSIKAPANLTVSNTNTGNDGSIQLTWESVANVSYRVHQVATAVTDNSTLSNFTTLTSYTSYDVNSGITVKEILGLTHGTTYYFAVTSIASSGSESALSNIVSSQPSLSAPTELNATSVGDAQASLSWTGINHSSASYTLHYATAEFTNIEPSAYANKLAGYSSRSVAVTTATITELANSVEYFVVITAVVNGQHSAASNQWTFTPILTAPSNLSGISDNTVVSLTWDGVADATYKVYYSTSTLENKTPAELQATGITAMDNVSTNSENVTSLVNGTPYYFVVTALKAGVESLPSAQFSVTPGATVPANLTVGTASNANNAILLTWGGIGSASAYTIHQATTSFGSNPPAANLSNATGYTNQTAGINTQLELTGLANGTTYYFVVTAITDNGESTPSNQVSAQPNIAAPQNLTAETSEGQAKLSWETVAGASYVIHQASSAFADLTTLSNATDYNSYTAAVGENEKTITLINGKTYHFIITAVRGGQHSAASNSATASPVLPAPTGLSAASGISQASLNWNEVAGATYKVYYATTDLASHTSAAALQALAAVQITAANTNTATIRGLTNERNYYFKVTAVKAGIESVPSVQASALPTFSAPTGLSATAGISQASLSWNEVAGVTYKVYYATTDLTNHTSAAALQGVAGIASTTVSANSTVITNLTNDTTYYFVVTAIKDSVESLPSAQANALPTFPAPTGLSATAGISQASLSWNEVAGVTYKVYYATMDLAGHTSAAALQGVAGIASTTVSANSAVITNLTNDTTYYFVVTAIKDSVESIPSVQASAFPTFPAPTGLSATAGISQATLSWNAVTNASYKVYYGKESFANLDTISNYNTVNGTMVAVASTAVNHTIKGLSNDTLYYFVITAVIADAESAASTEATATLVAVTNLGSISTATRAVNISSAGQVDWYQFSASTSANYVALAVGNSTTAIGFYNAEPADANSCTATTDNGTEKKNTYATQDTTANETYYLCVTAPTDATGTYDLNVVSVNSTVSTNNASFIYFANDLVLAKDTNLLWQRTDNTPLTWTAAVNYCDALTLAGYDNWYLPTLDELTTIIEKDVTLKVSFTNNYSNFWSSTEVVSGGSTAWRIKFNNGNAGTFLKGADGSVRCVVR